jgi:anti-anti-sigma regulatory factor
VGFLDSAGVSAVLMCRADAAQLDCRLRLRDPQPDVRRVLRILGLLNLVQTSAHLTPARTAVMA